MHRKSEVEAIHYYERSESAMDMLRECLDEVREDVKALTIEQLSSKKDIEYMKKALNWIVGLIGSLVVGVAVEIASKALN
jgi:hypothetical protein